MHEERYRKVLTKIVEDNLPVAFLSTNSIEQAVEQTKNFRAQGLNITKLIVIDNPPPGDIDFSVVHVSKAAQIYPQPEYVFVMGNKDLKFAEKFMPAAKIIWQPYANTDAAYEMFMTHLPELQEVYESLIDEESRKTFRGYWLSQISNLLGEAVYATTSQYICAGFIPQANDIVIDCGACDGQTAARFVKMGCKVFSFEMDKFYFDMAAQVAQKYNFVAENLALGAYNHETTYSRFDGAHGASRQDVNGTQKALVVSLDSYVSEKNLPRVDFIKMDVEGAELDILKGSANTIARFKPILAISVYHKLDDFWTLMNFVKSVRPDYEFAMRQSYETPEEEPVNFRGGTDYLVNLGLEPKAKGYGECVLFAR